MVEADVALVISITLIMLIALRFCKHMYEKKQRAQGENPLRKCLMHSNGVYRGK